MNGRALTSPRALAEALEPSGWIGRPPVAIAAELGVGVPAVESVLHRLQRQAEPTGLFARNLADCLEREARRVKFPTFTSAEAITKEAKFVF